MHGNEHALNIPRYLANPTKYRHSEQYANAYCARIFMEAVPYYSSARICSEESKDRTVV